MSISSFIADPITQAEVDYRRERAFQQYSRRAAHRAGLVGKAHRWSVGKRAADTSVR